MSDLLNELEQLLPDAQSRAEYRHELAISTFTNAVSRRMADEGVSQAELARRLGVSRARVSQLLQHTSSPTLRTMVEVASALGCEVVPVVAPCGQGPGPASGAGGRRSRGRCGVAPPPRG
ncbi:MAG: helix-turn-helix transcriptional regulator [Coriobacteriia bacterium]|nr:helix-turn-helix transcriptional regulator [Coriobacteriia bacterium]